MYVGDITYLPCKGGKNMYLATVIDDPVWRTSLLRTGLRALLTAAAAVVLAVPMAYAWSRRLLAGERLMAVTK